MSNSSDRLASALFRIQTLAIDIGVINMAITNGDIVSPQKALPKADLYAQSAAFDLREMGIDEVSIGVYVAGGGFVGVTYEFRLDVEQHKGSFTPKRP